MNNIFISVIVIGYNIEKYIDRCMKSVMELDYNNYEVIYVDDGSTDATLSKVKGYENKVYIISKENGGIISARKEGLKKANGEYVIFVDGDDWVNEDLLSNLVKDVNAEGRVVDIVSSSMYRQCKDGSFWTQINGIRSGICAGETYLEYILNDKNNHHMFPKLYRKEFLMKAGYMEYPNITVAEDLLTNAFLGMHNPLVFFNNSVNYYYCYNATSVIRRGDHGLLKQIETLELMEEYMKDILSRKDMRILMDYQWFIYYYTYVLESENYVSKRVKAALGSKIKKYIKEYSDNPYCLEKLKDLKTNHKWILRGYIRCPYVMIIAEPIIRWIAKVKGYILSTPGRRYEKKYAEEMKLYYQNKTWEMIDNITEKKNIFLIGTSDRSNLGDHLIALSAKQILEDCFENYTVHEITGDHFRNERSQITKVIGAEDIIFITGGGFLGDLWMDEEKMVRDILEDYPNNQVIILPQTIYFADDNDNVKEYVNTCNKYNAHNNLTLFARDSQSYHLFKKMFPNKQIELFPDLALLWKERISVEKESVALLCFRADKESVIAAQTALGYEKYLLSIGMEVGWTSTLHEGEHCGDIVLEKRKEKVYAKLNEFGRARLIITDRLHGMILCALVGTPCIAFDNVSKKVSSVYNDWLKELPYIRIADGGDDISSLIEQLLQIEEQSFQYELFANNRISLCELLKELIH